MREGVESLVESSVEEADLMAWMEMAG